MKSILTIFFGLFLFTVQSLAMSEGPVLKGSPEEAEISKAVAEILTTKTGCQIAEKFFLLREGPMSSYFGIDTKSAGEIANKCPGNEMPSFSFFYKIPKSERAPKSYFLHIDPLASEFHGWTDSNNVTHIFLKEWSPSLLRKILAHEIVITMDDKFFLQTDDFAKLRFDGHIPPDGICKVDRFLINPYYQTLLASLRAYRMELLFAHDLNDQGWLREMGSLPFLNDNSVQSFSEFADLMKGFAPAILHFYKTYYDNCTHETTNIESLSTEDILNLVQRDWEALKDLGEERIKNLMEFLIQEVAISSSDSNIINFGPRPVIGPGGWSLKMQLQGQKITIPQRDNAKDNLTAWELAHKDRFEQIKNQKPDTTVIPQKSSSTKPEMKKE